MLAHVRSTFKLGLVEIERQARLFLYRAHGAHFALGATFRNSQALARRLSGQATSQRLEGPTLRPTADPEFYIPIWNVNSCIVILLREGLSNDVHRSITANEDRRRSVGRRSVASSRASEKARALKFPHPQARRLP